MPDPASPAFGPFMPLAVGRERGLTARQAARAAGCTYDWARAWASRHKVKFVRAEFTPETREKRREAMIARWSSPEGRAQFLAASRGAAELRKNRWRTLLTEEEHKTFKFLNRRKHIPIPEVLRIIGRTDLIPESQK